MCSSTHVRYLSRAIVLMLAVSHPFISGFTSPESMSKPKTEMRGISKWNEEYRPDDENDGPVANGIVMPDMLSETVRRKKKGSKEYKPHDNRDALPYLVRVKTPDPYTQDGEMLKQARKNSNAAKKKSDRKGTRRRNLAGMDSNANAIAASVYSRKKDGSLYKVLGQFELEKNTNCGDRLEVGEREFEVVTARSQFKYAGGKRFVMIRKILEVKEITRIAEEATLTRLMEKEKECEPSSGKNFE